MALRAIDPRNPRWLRVNQKFCDMLGYTREQLLGLTSLDITLPEERHLTDKYNKRLLEGKLRSYSREKRYLRKDGVAIWTNIGLSAVPDSDNIPVQAILIIEDISERKAVEEALRVSEQNYRALFENAAAGIGRFRITDGKVTMANKRLAQLFGYERVGQFMDEYSFAEDHVVTGERERLISLYRQHPDRTFEVSFTTRNGSTIVVANQGWVDEPSDRVDFVMLDITKRKRIETALRKSEALHRQGARMARLGHWEWDDTTGKLLWCSQEYARIYEMSVDEMLSSESSFEESLKYVHPDDCERYANAVREMNSRQSEFELEYRILTRTGTVRYVRELGEPVLDEIGDMVRSIGTLQDITERKRAEQTLSFQATHDALTGLINRSEFERRVGRVLETARTSQDKHALCYMDLDQFKVINDTCGHIAGDELLRQLGQLLTASVRKRDTLARLGGDEFGVLMEHCTLEQAHRVADDVRRAVEGFRFVWENRVFRVGVSIGLVPIVETSESITNLLSAADSACYAAKEGGRNRVHVYHLDDEVLAQRHGEMQWVARIDQALEEGRLCLWSQPIAPVVANADEGEHFEVLLRLVDEQEKIVPPEVFLPAAERYGLSSRLDRWVVGATFRWLHLSPQLLQRLYLCCINLSGTSLADEEFLDFIQEQFKQSPVPPEKICFEVTETAAIANLTRAKTFMQVLKTQGCRFALDDFGSGLSSFAYLKTLPVDYLKIDGSFVKDIAEDEVSLALVRSINDVGKVMGKQTIAEFVENEAILEKLCEIEVDYAQGYGVAHPAPIE